MIQMPQQTGGVQRPVIEELKAMSNYFLLGFLILVCVYVSRIPSSILIEFRKSSVQFLGILAIVFITIYYGPIHGILSALAFSLVVSHALRMNQQEDLVNYSPSIYITDADNTTVIPKNHRWFGEKILGETPILIREKGVTTSAVQDLSERTMGTNTSNVSR
jgi:hypothetical protein